MILGKEFVFAGGFFSFCLLGVCQQAEPLDVCENLKKLAVGAKLVSG